MAYAGTDGTDTRLHLAVSADGTAWEPLGTILPADEHDAVAATDPWLLNRGTDWWLFYSGYDGPGRASILAAVSHSGTAWDRVGLVLEPAAGELGVSEPSVLAIRRRFLMFFVSNPGVELWFSIMERRLLRHGEFTSTDQLADRIIEFIKAYNRQAKPFRWTYEGRPLKVA